MRGGIVARAHLSPAQLPFALVRGSLMLIVNRTRGEFLKGAEIQMIFEGAVKQAEATIKGKSRVVDGHGHQTVDLAMAPVEWRV
jgi:hypothetical protein